MKLSLYKTSFGKNAKEYQKYRRTYDKKLYELLFSLLENVRGTKKYSILDLGCGTGKSTEPLFATRKKRVITVTGVDPDNEMLHEARLSAKKHKLPIAYLQAGAENLPFQQDTFDAIISGAAFHWFATKRTLAKIKKVLVKDGIFFVFWVQYSDTEKPAIGEEIYDKFEWRGIPKRFRGVPYVKKCLKEAGFKKVSTVIIPFIETKTVEEAVGLLRTNSSYMLFTEDEQKQFVREMTAAHKKALGTKKAFVDEMEIRVCYGFK